MSLVFKIQNYLAVLCMVLCSQYACLQSTINYPFSNKVMINEAGVRIHQGVGELTSFNEAIDKHMTFFDGIFNGDCEDVAQWFFGAGHKLGHKNSDNVSISNESKKIGDVFTWLIDQGKALLGMRKEVVDDIGVHFEKFPNEAMLKNIRTEKLKDAMEYLYAHGSFEKIITYWSILKKVFNSNQIDVFDAFFATDIEVLNNSVTASLLSIGQRRIFYAYTFYKDLVDVINILYHFWGYVVKSHIHQQRDFVSDFMQIYESTNNLPIEQTLEVVTNFINEFIKNMHQLSLTSEAGFEGWLKSKWFSMPVAMGVVVVKIMYYFFSAKLVIIE